MDSATLFDYTMRTLWGDDDVPTEAIALASYVKTHQRVNPENTFDVLGIIWPEATVHFEPANDGKSMVAHITFPDSSRALTEAQNGIGSSVEVV